METKLLWKLRESIRWYDSIRYFFFQNIQQCSMSEDELDSSCIADNEINTEHTSEVSQVITPKSQFCETLNICFL